MTEPENINTSPERVPVSRVQRFLPFLSFSLMALGAAGAGYYIVRITGSIRDVDTGLGAIARWMAGGMWSVSTGLILALIVGFAAIITYAAMMFSQKRSTGPSAIWLLLVGILGAAAVSVGWHTIAELVFATAYPPPDSDQFLATSKLCGYVAIGLGALTTIAGLVLTFVPMRARPGRKYGALIVMALAEFLMLCGVVYVMMQASAITKLVSGH